ncbi:MAG: carbohydrate-binding protein [Massilia sp.]
MEPGNAGGQNLRDIHDGAYVQVRQVDFGAKGARAFTASLSSTATPKQATGANIEIRLGKLDGKLIGTLPVAGTGGAWQPQSARVSGASGIQDVFFVFRGTAGEQLFKFDYWQFSKRDLPTERTSTASQTLSAVRPNPAP